MQLTPVGGTARDDDRLQCRWGKMCPLRGRRARLPDLLIAATAEISGRIVLHVDKDFELIAQLTSQPIERLTT